MRETGYYWVRWRYLMDWQIAYYSGQHCANPGWWITKIEGYFHDEDIFKINETRILNPDER